MRYVSVMMNELILSLPSVFSTSAAGVVSAASESIPHVLEWTDSQVDRQTEVVGRYSIQ